jgi:anthranilate phosphoribosyltransferase
MEALYDVLEEIGVELERSARKTESFLISGKPCFVPRG